MLNKFNCDLKWIDPALLVTEEKLNKVESFFLGLGVILMI